MPLLASWSHALIAVISKTIRRWALPPYPELSIAFFGQGFRHGADNGTVQFEDTAIAPNLQVRILWILAEHGELLIGPGNFTVGAHGNL